MLTCVRGDEGVEGNGETNGNEEEDHRGNHGSHPRQDDLNERDVVETDELLGVANFERRTETHVEYISFSHRSVGPKRNSSTYTRRKVTLFSPIRLIDRISGSLPRENFAGMAGIRDFWPQPLEWSTLLTEWRCR